MVLVLIFLPVLGVLKAVHYDVLGWLGWVCLVDVLDCFVTFRYIVLNIPWLLLASLRRFSSFSSNSCNSCGLNQKYLLCSSM